MKISKADCPKMIKDTTPVQDGFFMPGEFEQHQGCIMIWPERPGSWHIVPLLWKTLFHFFRN